MRILPDKPSLDFLRREAKDLLAALRESGLHESGLHEPSSEPSLAVAQRALAAQYGMRDWTELKAEAERRAGNPPVAPEGLADALATTFGLGRVARPAMPVSFTLMGRCWSITTDRGRWLAVTVFDWITEAQAEVGARLRDAAVAAGIATPTPVRSPRGLLIETVQGQNWRVHEWIEVGPPPVTPTSVAVARRIGATFGTLHSLAIPSDAPVHPHLVARRSRAQWEGLLDEARTARKPWAEHLDRALPALHDLGSIEAEISADELILCNRNLNPEHVRVGHNDVLVITEWDFAGSLTPELELGSALMHWTMDRSVNHKAIAAFRDGYVRAAGRWPKLELASFAVAVTAYLNWTYDRICEAVNQADDDRVAFSSGEAADILKRPMTRDSLQQLLAAVDGLGPTGETAAVPTRRSRRP